MYGIFTYTWLEFMVNVETNPYMEHMGHDFRPTPGNLQRLARGWWQRLLCHSTFAS